MALPIAVPAFLARRLVISLTCLLARRRTAAFAGVGVHITLAPRPARGPDASLTEGTLAPTSGAFAQIGVYFLGRRTVSAHAGALVGA
jgi:proline iminopeptidase